MKTLTRFFSRTRNANPNPEPSSRRSGETSGVGGETADAETVAVTGEMPPPPPAPAAAEEERRRALMEKPPTDDVCPICFGDFDVPCRGPCGHWYCGNCILLYWNFCYSFRPCKCPMCSQRITKLTAEASLYHKREVEIRKVLQNVDEYNRLHLGGLSGLTTKLLFAVTLCMKRRFRRMLDDDGPAVILNDMRLIAMFLGLLYSFIPFDFLRIGGLNVNYVLEGTACALTLTVFLVRLYLRRRRLRNLRELADLQAERN
ncbi:hypothetical protein ACP275_02G070900 [Erythranthe tilingii]